jgi:hypothetical protein
MKPSKTIAMYFNTATYTWQPYAHFMRGQFKILKITLLKKKNEYSLWGCDAL